MYPLLLTGTPIHNNLSELWALLKFVCPTFFADSRDYFERAHPPTDVSNRNRSSNSKQAPLKQSSKINRAEQGRRHSKRQQDQQVEEEEEDREEEEEQTREEGGGEDKLGSVSAVLALFMLRRTKAGVEQSLLPKREVVVRVPLAPQQLRWVSS